MECPANNIKVSIAVITYNHEKFIREALDSILSQVINFKIDINIGDDFSTDNTRAILEEYKCRYPDIINLILHTTNIGMMNNFASTLQACKGKYIALLEGDDYWCDVNKLQTQVDFMDKNEGYAISFHKVKKIFDDTDNEEIILNNELIKDTYEIDDLLPGNFIFTNSVLYRNNLFATFPKGFLDLPMGDWPLHILNAKYGKIHFSNKVMSVYRIHGSSEWSSKTKMYRKNANLKTYYFIKENIPDKYKDVVRSKISVLHTGLALNEFRVCNYSGFIKHILKGMFIFPYIGYLTSNMVRESIRNEYNAWINSR